MAEEKSSGPALVYLCRIGSTGVINTYYTIATKKLSFQLGESLCIAGANSLPVAWLQVSCAIMILLLSYIETQQVVVIVLRLVILEEYQVRLKKTPGSKHKVVPRFTTGY